MYVWLAEECTEMRMDTSARDVSPHNTPDSDADGTGKRKKLVRLQSHLARFTECTDRADGR
ncbi:hypothetical protein N185_35950 [Sinorhizobium sp. GW3]|nr:hypothetical protein N185_35950 [Sinorhizobium sp. GW3]